MMDDKKTQELIDFLAGLGFKGLAFEQALRQRLATMNNYITIPFKEMRNKSELNYLLYIEKDYQFNAYRLERFDATLRPSFIIEDKVINGVALKDLDRRMQRIYWADYFEHNSPQNPQEADQVVTSVMNDLLRLNGAKDADGFSIVPMLQYRHWPFPVFQLYNNDKEIPHTIQVKETFSPVPSGVCDTNLAFHILNGNYEELFAELLLPQFDEVISDDFSTEVERILSEESEYEEIKLSEHRPEYNIQFTIPVHFQNGGFEADKYNATATIFPEIQHGIFNGIDSKELEAKMHAVDWTDDNLFSLSTNDMPVYPPYIETIMEHLEQVWRSKDGAFTADQLMAKYYRLSGHFQSVMTESAWQYFEELPKREMSFDIETEAAVALNLLKGKAVAMELVHGLNPDLGEWVRLEIDKGLEGGYEYVPIPGFYTEQIRNQLRLLPAKTDDWHIKQLKRGETVKLELKDGSRLSVKAIPEEKTLELYDHLHNYIPFNFKLSRDWQPDAKLLPRHYNHNQLPPDETSQGKKL